MSLQNIPAGFHKIPRQDGIFQERVHNADQDELEYHYNPAKNLLRVH
ncbi:MAG: hypothetical protein HOP04_04195 [Methylophilaceae bacterium]|nr:hypothetical protein [Methylophilaceae bacterium]